MGRLYNKSEIIDELATEAKISKAAANRVLNSLQDIVFREIKNGNKVKLSGFVAFDPVDRAPREISNPKTGKKMLIPAKKSVRMRALDKFKKFLNS